jgi:hypothetical protein
MTGVAKHTVLNLLQAIDCALLLITMARAHQLRARRVQIGRTWVAIHADSHLVASYIFGGCAAGIAEFFMNDVAKGNRSQDSAKLDLHRFRLLSC